MAQAPAVPLIPLSDFARPPLSVPDLCRELAISTATFYKWRSKYGGMDVSLIARMKELEAENARLRKMYVEEKIKAEIVAEALAKKD
ncbi:transposase [Burkholderia sp. LA-2-3-30-S1-D2]|nr:transposase [Burkholderia sp. LA-2-3-30-S1-D2]